jgi:hypothetical protein
MGEGGVVGDEKPVSVMSMVMANAAPFVFATRSVVPSCWENAGTCRPVTARVAMVTPAATLTNGQVRFPLGFPVTIELQVTPFTTIEKSARADGATATMARTPRKPASLFIYSPPFGMSNPDTDS